MTAGDSGGYTSDGPERQTVWCLGRVRRFVKAKTGAISGGVLEDMDMRARRAVLARLEWSGTPGGRPVSGS
jgi:hypothetical protein